ncbi:MAG: DNA polymerase III subunit gamma/tau [Candidatus Spechtbacterales bacterium]
MSVLYRKYRPTAFADIVGQEHVVQTLGNAIKMGNVAHAYLFAGPRGTGKTTMARLLAKNLNCIAPKNSTACLKCDVCREVDKGNFTDLIEMDAASTRGIDDVREIKESVRVLPTKSKYKIYILDEAHMLTGPAASALLKVLEEPPEHVIFILATTDAHKILPTIISRTQRFDFRLLTRKEISERLAGIAKKEKKPISDDAVKLITTASGGSMRDAESILGKVLFLDDPSAERIQELLGLTGRGEVSAFLSYIAENKKEEALQHIGGIVKKGGDLEQFAQAATGYARVLMFLKLSPSSHELILEDFSKEEAETAKLQAEKLTEKKIYSIIREFIGAGNEIKYSPLPQLPLELAAINLTTE